MPGVNEQLLQTVALLGTYVPRQCGIATFTKDLRDSIAAVIGDHAASVLAIDDLPDGYPYPSEVRLQIPQYRQADYLYTADWLNINQIDTLLIQHEFGIFGGLDGSLVLDLMRNVRIPVITTLHTVLQDPSPSQRAVMKELVRLSDRLVVMSQRAADLLGEVFHVSPGKIAYIPHGIPDVPFVDPNFLKDQFGVEGRRVLLTFGLIGPGKGIEVAIRAMPEVVARFPDVVYLVLGATHPQLLRHEGNAYRNSLERLVEQLKLEDHVVFHNRYVSRDELQRYLSVADVYVLPYPNRSQVTSGTLAYALGAGKPVVSTPFWHAEELLADGRGVLFPFNDSPALAAAVCHLLGSDTERHAMRKKAYVHARPMVWSEVASAYLRLMNEVLAERRTRPRPTPPTRGEIVDIVSTPDVSLAHLRRMTDDTGMLQHATHATPDRSHGYCADDNARALIATLMYYDLTRDESVLPLVDNYMAFLHHAFNRSAGRFRNFMGYDRNWTEDVGSDDSHGRCIWALGTAVQLAPGEQVRSLATRLLADALGATAQLASPRAWSFALVGIHRYLTHFSGDSNARRIRNSLAERLMDLFDRNATPEWPWCEDQVTYANARLSHALILTGRATDNEAMLRQGLASLTWLLDQQMFRGRVSLIGNNGWLNRDGGRARFDQQPIEAMTLIEACAEAYRATADDQWFDRTRLVLEWFLGNNDTGTQVYDAKTGGCRDGLHPGGSNLNQGAESTLAWLISVLTVMDLNRARTLAGDDADPTASPLANSQPDAQNEVISAR